MSVGLITLEPSSPKKATRNNTTTTAIVVVRRIIFGRQNASGAGLSADAARHAVHGKEKR